MVTHPEYEGLGAPLDAPLDGFLPLWWAWGGGGTPCDRAVLPREDAGITATLGSSSHVASTSLPDAAAPGPGAAGRARGCASS